MKDFDWRILASLHGTRSLTRTAEQLFTSQPNITKRLRSMEEELAIQIVVRSPRGVVFTPQGEYLVGRAVEILRMMDDVREKVHEVEDSPTGIIRLAAPNSFVRNELPSILEHYRQSPRITFQLVTRLSDDIPRLLESGEIDVGFAHGDADRKFLRYHYSSEVLNIVSRNEISFEDLPKRPQIDFNRSVGTRKAIQSWWQERFESPWNVALQVNTGDICIEIVRKGIGFAFFFGTSYFREDEGLHRLIASGPDGLPMTRDTWLLYTERNYKRTLIRRFVDFIVARHKRT